jgi:molecular chaperone DnaK
MKVFGIDLGTSNSLIAYKENEQVIICKNREAESLIPSVVSFIDEEAYVVGKKAKDLLESNPETTIFSSKRFIGRSKKEIDLNNTQVPYKFNPHSLTELEIQVYNKTYSIPEISARILLELKKMATLQSGEEVEKVVITVPAFFNDNQRTATQFAAKLAGLQAIKIINEPTAAALAYGLQEKKSAHILVYDLGGGTFDVSVLKLHEGIFEVLSTHGDTMLGGNDIDNLLSDYISAQCNADSKDKHITEHLRFLAEECKKKLSFEEAVLIQVNLGKTTSSIKISRDTFNMLIKDLIQQTMKSVKTALRDAKLKVEDIDDVVLVGGSSRIPLIHSQLEAIFGKKPHMELNPDEVVAHGAAIQAAILSGDLMNQVYQ